MDYVNLPILCKVTRYQKIILDYAVSWLFYLNRFHIKYVTPVNAKKKKKSLLSLISSSSLESEV